MLFSDLQYDCLQCGKGCRVNWRIPVEPHLVSGLENSQSGAAVRSRSYHPIELVDDQPMLGHNKEGNCVFLADNLCSIHAEVGPTAKPHQCRQFPFLPVATPDGLYMGMSFFCTAVQQRHGRPGVVHEDWLRDLLKPAPLTGNDDSRVALAPGSWIRWQDYLRLEQCFYGWIAECTPREATWRFTWALLLLHEQMSEQSEYRFPLEEIVAHEPPPDFSLFMESIRRSFLPIFISLVEFAPGPERTLARQALGRGERVQTARIGEISLPTSECLAERLSGAALEPVRRYLSHRVFGKFLVQGDNLLTYTGILWGIVAVLEFYSAGATEEQFWGALDVVETELITHGSGADAVGPLLRDTLLRCFNTLPAHSKRPGACGPGPSSLVR
jgi:Fe-S-cluster containining protein